MSDRLKFIRKAVNINYFKANKSQLENGNNENENVFIDKKVKMNDSNKKSNLKNNFIKTPKIFYHIIIKILIFFVSIFKCTQKQLQENFPNITLKTKGKKSTWFDRGIISILSKNFYDKNKDKLTQIIINNKILGKNEFESNSLGFKSEKEKNDVTLIFNDYLTSTNNMFWLCEDIIEIDLSNFDTSHVKEMKSMFHGCSSLISLKLSNFETDKVKDMSNMFNWCSNLVSLDLSSFNTSQVEKMESMFCGCSSLITLDLSNFETDKVKNMNYMFLSCSNLVNINLQKANINLVIKSEMMFYSFWFKASKYLMVISENEGWEEELNIKRYINCIYNNSFEKKMNLYAIWLI